MLKVAQVRVENYPHSACFDHVAAALRSAAATLPDIDGTVIIGANLAKSIPPGSIVWNFEQVEKGSSWLNDRYLEICHEAEQLWDYSPANIAAWRAEFGLEAKLLPLAYDKAMVGAVAKCNAKLDRPRFYGSINPRRREILERIQHHQLPTPIYGARLDRALSQSPCVLNVHFYEAAIFEIVRCSYLFANAVPVISERSADDYFYDIPDLFHDLDEIERRVRLRRYPDGEAQRRAYMGQPHLAEYLEDIFK